MNVEAMKLGGEHTTIPTTLTADAASGEIIKLADNRAAVVAGGLNAEALKSGTPCQVITRGPIRIKKATGVTLASGRAYWDISANTAITVGSAATGDMDCGQIIGGGASADDFVDVDLNSPAGTAAS